MVEVDSFGLGVVVFSGLGVVSSLVVGLEVSSTSVVVVPFPVIVVVITSCIVGLVGASYVVESSLGVAIVVPQSVVVPVPPSSVVVPPGFGALCSPPAVGVEAVSPYPVPRVITTGGFAVTVGCDGNIISDIADNTWSNPVVVLSFEG